MSSKEWRSITRKAAELGTTIFDTLAAILAVTSSFLLFDVCKDHFKKYYRVSKDDYIELKLYYDCITVFLGGFTLFLWIIISRLTDKAKAATTKAQDESAGKTAELHLDENKKREKEGKEELEEIDLLNRLVFI